MGATTRSGGEAGAARGRRRRSGPTDYDAIAGHELDPTPRGVSAWAAEAPAVLRITSK